MPYNGTIVGSPTFGTGRFGQALTAPSETDYISLPTGTYPYNLSSGAFWVGAFLKIGTVYSGYKIAFSFGTDGGSWIGTVDGYAACALFSVSVVSTVNICDGAQHFVVFEWTGSAVRLWVDGVLSTATPSGTLTAPASSGGIVGRYYNSNNTASIFPWPGSIDEIILRSGAFSAVPSAAYTGTESGLQALYHLDGNANDSTGGSFSGTVAVSPTTLPLGAVTAITLTGTGTAWTSSTKPTVTGGSGAYLSNVAVNGQVITATLWPGSAAGTLTLGNTTDSATASVTAAANVTTNVIFHGDSLTYGAQGSNPGTTQATRLATVLAGLGPTATGTNSGVSGQSLQQMIGNAATAVDALYQPGKVNILVVQGGHNDMGLVGGGDAATAISRIQTYLTARKAAHSDIKIIWATETPADNVTYYPADFDAKAATVNSFVRANRQSLGIDAISDIAADPLMGQPGQEHNLTYYSSDNVHPVDEGYKRWGFIDLAAVKSAIAGSVAAAATTLAF